MYMCYIRTSFWPKIRFSAAAVPKREKRFPANPCFYHTTPDHPPPQTDHRDNALSHP